MSLIVAGTTYLAMDIFYNDYKNSKKKRPRIVQEEDVLKDFIANENTKSYLNLLIDQIKFPEKYDSRNIKRIKGVLLYGPPGTGKTLIAKVNLKYKLSA